MTLLIKFILALSICSTFWIQGSPLSDKVVQSPPDMIILSSLSESPVLQCSHRDSSYDRILWYKQLQNKQFIFLGYLLGSSHHLEPGFINKYTFAGNGNTNANLTIKKLEFNDTATYFCAASTQCHTCGAPPLQILQTLLRDLLSKHLLKCDVTSCVCYLRSLQTATLGSFNMFRVLVVVLASVFWQPGPVSSSKVHQSPPDVLLKFNSTLDLKCSHSDTNYNTILWYQQLTASSELKLIGYLYYKSVTIETEFKELFEVSGDGEKEAHLHFLKLRQAQDDGMYFCAARAQH
ncbi:uncharacterized protein [Danio rerio]|uniref:Uncharacterized protein n=1 Tax=Danio rerio TaxID=7955 RepID=A0AC58HP67_DANRE